MRGVKGAHRLGIISTVNDESIDISLLLCAAFIQYIWSTHHTRLVNITAQLHQVVILHCDGTIATLSASDSHGLEDTELTSALIGVYELTIFVLATVATVRNTPGAHNYF